MRSTRTMEAVGPLVVRVSRAASAGALARGGGARFELGVDSGAWRRVDNPYRIAHYGAFSTERIERLGADPLRNERMTLIDQTGFEPQQKQSTNGARR